MADVVQHRLIAFETKATADTTTLIREIIVVPSGVTAEPEIFVVRFGSLFAIRLSGCQSAPSQDLFYHCPLRHGIYVASRGFPALTAHV